MHQVETSTSLALTDSILNVFHEYVFDILDQYIVCSNSGCYFICHFRLADRKWPSDIYQVKIKALYMYKVAVVLCCGHNREYLTLIRNLFVKKGLIDRVLN